MAKKKKAPKRWTKAEEWRAKLPQMEVVEQWHGLPKTTPFSRENPYNHTTTRKALICQYRKNARLISALIAVPYKKVKIWLRIQWPSPMSLALKSLSYGTLRGWFSPGERLYSTGNGYWYKGRNGLDSSILGGLYACFPTSLSRKFRENPRSMRWHEAIFC